METKTSAVQLLREAAILYDDPRYRLDELASQASWRGFDGGGRWMRAVLEILRNGQFEERRIPFWWYGVLKYSLAGLAALIILGIVVYINNLLLLPLVVLAFYVVEVQFVFLFPLLIDGEQRALFTSREMTLRSGGTLNALRVVLPLAAMMLLGGFVGKGFLRSWCLGCLAVLLWYEQVRKQSPPAFTQVLELGASRDLHCRSERIDFVSNGDSTRILYVSDTHLSARQPERVAEQVVVAAEEAQPNTILLGGDLVDDRSGLVRLPSFVEQLVSVAPVYAVAGNHDLRVGEQAVKSAVADGGGAWLNGAGVTLDQTERSISVFGDVNSEISTGAFNILCAHDPAVFPAANRNGFDLVFAGHLHGGQVVLCKFGERLYPGALVYRWNGLRFTRSSTTMLVSRGVTDTIPLRYNCPREVIVCDL